MLQICGQICGPKLKKCLGASDLLSEEVDVEEKNECDSPYLQQYAL